MQVKEAFENYYLNIYQERWPTLVESLSTKRAKWARDTRLNFNLDQLSINSELTDWHYLMDPASAITANCLRAQPGEKILDMCAAPGGKSLILAKAMQNSGELVLNEISTNRRLRLKRVIEQFLPEDNHIKIIGMDGIKFGITKPNYFDAILLDAPCSSEEHLIQNPKEMIKWTKKRSQKLAAIQYGLLCSALLSLKPTGRLIYSTCALSPLENDGVIEKLVTKKGDSFYFDSSWDETLQNYKAEKNRYGWHFLPDQSKFGPMYLSILIKK
jgi:16S rRNA C967 or C1407 C5-methylase (RsmB/RsmF family)